MGRLRIAVAKYNYKGLDRQLRSTFSWFKLQLYAHKNYTQVHYH